MARRRRDRADEVALEFLEGDLTDGFDVEFGAAAEPDDDAHRPRRGVWAGVGVVAALGALVGVVAIAGSGDDASVPTSSVTGTTAPTTTASTSSAPPTTDGAPDPTPVATSSAPIVASTYPPLVPAGRDIGGPIAAPADLDPLLTHFDGAQLYLWDTESGPAALVAYDVATGTTTPIDLGTAAGPLRAVLPTDQGVFVDAGDVVLTGPDGPIPLGVSDAPVSDFSRTGPRIAAGPAGRVWVRTLAPPSLVLFDSQTMNNPYELPLGAELIGVSAAGRPVVRGPDLRSFEIANDGSSVLLAEGVTTPVENGWYAELVCEPAAECRVMLHGVSSPITFAINAPDDLERMAVRFAPSGNHVAVAVDDRVRIIDTVAAEGVDVALPFVPTGDAVSRAAANYFRLARDLVWTPDGEALGLLTDTGIVFVGLDGTLLGQIVVDPEQPLRYVPVALG